jgi:hypothetical protein
MFAVATHIPANFVVGAFAVAMPAVVAPMNQIQPTVAAQFGHGGLHS